jgi:hypothetical protein
LYVSAVTRVLMLLAKKPDPETEDQARRGEIPFPEYIAVRDRCAATLWDFHDVERSTHPLVKAARGRGERYGLAMLGFVHRKEFDHIYCTGEDVGFPLGMLMRGVGDLGRITSVIHHGGTRKRLAILRGLGPRVWRSLICLSADQRRVLTEDARVPGHQVVQLPQWIDTRFYDPERATAEVERCAFSCGQESRDYPLLEEAARGIDLRFRVKASGWAPGAGFKGAEKTASGTNIERIEARLSYGELRDCYAGAQFIVVPVENVRYAAGVTSICEAMAMGKAVVATASPGVVDYVRDGETGFLAPCGDAPALRRAIEKLAGDEALCRDMGERGRRWVTEEMSTWRYAERAAGLFGL